MFNQFFYALIFIFGLIIGSFLNCVIYRLETSKSFLKGRSFCPHCNHKLALFDLIPVFSFICLKGKCRYCAKKISLQYPLVEIVTGFLFLLTAIYFGIDSFLMFFLFLLLPFLIVIFVYDFKHYIIPDRVVYPAIGLTLFYQLLSNKSLDIILNPLFSAFSAASFFIIIILFSKGRWMGWGDVKMGFLMGLLLGSPNIILALVLSVFSGALVGVLLIILEKKTLKSQVPFGPFLIFGTFIAMFWGVEVINWYSEIFLFGL